MGGLPSTLELIDGKSREPDDRLPGTLDDPNTGLALSPRRASRLEQVDAALERAQLVHEARLWRDLGVEGRGEVLHRFADELAARAAQLATADALNTGVPIDVTTAMTAACADQVRGEVRQLIRTGVVAQLPGSGRGGPVRLHRDPWGPAVVLAPWNAPSSVAVGRAAAALAAGCPVIVKPSEWAPSSSALLIEAAEAAELPVGVLQVVQGDGAVGSRLVSDARVRAIAFTGSSEVGRKIASAAAVNFSRLQLELSGNNPVIVRADADITTTACALARGMTKLNGQWCEAPGKVLVSRRLHDDLVEALLAELSKLRVGPSSAPGTELGPIAFAAHRARLQAQIDMLTRRGGAARVVFSDLPAQGWFLSPTVVTGVAPEVAMAEIFGPVVSVHPVDDDTEALALAALGPDGLAGYVFGSDVEAALSVGEHLRAGEVKINGTSLLDLTVESHQSFWGTSGIGGHGYGEMLEFFRGSRIVGVDNPDAPI